MCQEPPVKDWWHDNATLRVVLDISFISPKVLNNPQLFQACCKSLEASVLF